MGATKDFIKFRQHIRTRDLKVNEQYLLELFFEYHNTQYNYCFLKFEQIMQAFNTTSKNRISSTIKKLEKKGLIRVDRNYTNNRYYIIGIENFINQVNTKPKDSDGKPPINGQVHFTELTPEEKEVINVINFTQNQAKSLLQLCNNKVDKLISVIRYAIKNGASNVYGYVKALLLRNVNVDDKVVEHKKKSIPFINNCSSREYTNEWYLDVESRLLGWT
ncbi:MAG: helix-turn-helix domain-containing protein [Clostridium beijerinckii]|jgi:SOS-response transcriptional repressor LexA|nr:helix-turn-helix domain-containing protein [Clostridium beijerinckii]MCI1578935.1 helix-turn-helix domain-containing protein [Clostridium beijerinckii]MCI1582236.1 helix-turn-helix domain-containing protein [Clostridium beijerinckii]MCI1622753.1 helix-turn-helix domain-containing protein [Clostridium beijerinckii]